MIRIERDPAFWTAVAAHPALAGAIHGVQPAQIGALATMSDILPLASEHGGFLFQRVDRIGFVCELHTLFTPEGWGREVLTSGVEALNAVWMLGFQMVTTCEARINPRSRPPRTFGFIQAGDWQDKGVFGELRLWTLSRSAWDASGVRRLKCLH